MTLEVARRLADDGILWETVVVEEDTGGDPSPGAVTLLGPFAVDFDTPGFFNPESGNGVATLDIPAGTFVVPYAVVTDSFEGVAPGDEIQLQLLLDANSSGPILVKYDHQNLVADDPSIALRSPPTVPAESSSAFAGAAGLAVDDCKIVAVYWPAGATTITAGSIDIYAFVATP